MGYLGNQPATGENNSFKILDDISSYTLTFDGSSSSVVSTSDNTITENAHRFITGQRVTYTNGSGTDIGGLTDGDPYYIIKSDQNTIKLAASASDAINDVAISLSAVGTGSDHTLNVAFDSVNTKFKATYNNGTKAKMTRAAQLTISVNGVIQQPQDTSSPTNGFGFDLDSVIVFSTAPASTDAFWGHIVANNFASFDISDNTVDSFTGDNVTTDFTLSKSPANNQNVLVTLDGVVQYPSDATTTKAYSISENVISFASAPGLGVAIQVRHIGFAGATSSAVTGFYGRTGNVTFKDTDSLTVSNIVASSGLSTFSDLVVTGDLTVQGTTTTLDTLVTEVDKLEVAASNTNVAVAVTQSSTGDILRLYDGSTQVVTVADGGYVGIGTDNPTAPLHISGADAANTKIKLEDNDNGFAASEINVANGGRDLRIAAPQDIYFEDLDTNTKTLYIKDGGNVGIGTDNPSEKLEVTGKIRIEDDNPSPGLLIRDSDTDGDVEIYQYNSGDLQIINNATSRNIILQTHDGSSVGERLRITSSGTVGIGTDNPGASLQITADSPGILFQDSNSGSTESKIEGLSGHLYYTTDNVNRDHIFSATGGSESFRITGDGSVGIGTNDPTETLHVVGDLRVTGIITSGTGTITIDGVNNQITIGSGSSQVKLGGGLEYPTIRPTLDLNFAATKTLDRRITFTRDSLGTYTDELGVLKYSPNNTPRFDHDPDTGESLGLLIEESRTNLVTYSEDFSNAQWVENGASESLASSVTAPDGTTGSVYELIESSATSGHFMYDSVSVSSNTNYTWSVWMKANTRTYGYMTEGNTQPTTAFFNLSTGTLISISGTGSVSATAQKYPNGWVRCTMTFTTGASQTSANVQFGPHEDGSGFSYAGDGSSGIYVWGAQGEQGSFATSYIPTSGSTVTRSKDLAVITGTNFTNFYNQSEGAVVCKFGREQWAQADGDYERIWEIGDDTDNNNLNIFASSNGQDLRYRVRNGGTNQFGATTSNIGSNLFPSVAMAYKQNDFALISDGVVIDTDDGGDPPTVDRLHIGHSFNQQEAQLFNNRISYLKYYNKRLSNAQLQGLTSQ